MISELAKSIAHFFVLQKIIEGSKEKIYAYGLELLISDVLNTIIVLLIAVVTHTMSAVAIFVITFMLLRRYVGGFHAKSHFSCIGTLILVMLCFCLEVCAVSDSIKPVMSIVFICTALPMIFLIAPVEHPNKPMSEKKKVRLKKISRVLSLLTAVSAVIMMVFRFYSLSLYISSGMMLSAVMALLGHKFNGGEQI